MRWSQHVARMIGQNQRVVLGELEEEKRWEDL
jgi:hypothetical protein